MKKPNPLIPFVPIELDRPRTLHYNFGAFAAMERASGRRFIGPMSVQTWADLTIPGADNTLLLLYGGLYHEDPTITLQKCAEMIDFENADTIDKAIAEAISPVLQRAFKGKDEPRADDSRPTPATDPDGSTCGPLPAMTSDSQNPNSGN